MGEEITTIDISNAEVLSASSFTNVKNSIDIKIDNLGNLTDANDNAVTMLNFGDRGDHCVTVINAELPSNFSEGYRAYFLVDLKNKTYIQKCLMEGNIAKALITKEISLDSQSTECLFALIEADATTGNLREQQEIFVSDVFMGTVRSNFLDSNWMDADISVSEDLTVLDKFETPNPDKYTSMVWVNGETKLNAANMNNIIKGIDELKERSSAVEANPTEAATELLSKIKINDKILASGKTYQYDDIVENGTLKDGIFNEILQLAVLGCSNITIIQSDLLFTFVGLGAAMKNGSTVIGLVFHSNMVVYPTDTEKHSMCMELILFEDNSVSDGGTFNLPEPPAFSDNVQDKKYTLELRKSDSLSEFVPQWTEKSARTLVKDGTYHSKNGDIIFNTVSFTDEEIAQINNKEIDAISGKFVLKTSDNSVSQTDYFVRFDGSRFMSYQYDMDDFNTYISYTICGLVVMEGNQGIIMYSQSKTAFVPQTPEENNKILVTNNHKLVYEDKPNSVEANPSDAATATLSKLKVGDTTYDFNRTLIKNGTYVSEEGFATLNSFSFTAEEMEKINNGEIDMLIGEFNTRNETYYYNAKKYYSGDDDMPLFICSSYTLMNGESIHYNEVQIYPSLSQGGMISADSPFIPELPSDASTKKYTLKAINGTLTWIDSATDTETFNNVIVNSNVTAQGNISAVGKISTVGGLEVYGHSVFTKDLSTSATLKGAHVVAGNTELLPITPNPVDEATETLNKLKIGEKTFDVIPELAIETEPLTFENMVSCVNNVTWFNLLGDAQKIRNFVINQCGRIKLKISTPIGYVCLMLYPSLWADATNHSRNFEGTLCIETDLSSIGADNEANYINARIIAFEDSDNVAAAISVIPFPRAKVPSLPSDSASKTYTLRSVNGTIDWKDTSVGTQKFENVEVSGTITAGGKSLNAVEANPSDAATTSLNKIKIGNVTYNIVGSSSSGGSSGSDSSTGDSSFVAFVRDDVITNGTVNDGVFQELTNLINAHKIPVIVDDQRTYSYSGMAMPPDGSKNGLAFIAEVHMYDASSYTYFSGKLPLILWSDNSISEDAMAFGSIPTPPYDQTGTKQYVLSGTDIGLAWIDIDEKISSAITSTLEADY